MISTPSAQVLLAPSPLVQRLSILAPLTANKPSRKQQPKKYTKSINIISLSDAWSSVEKFVKFISKDADVQPS